VKALGQWQFYAVLFGAALAWYGLAVLFAHLIDGTTKNASSASIWGVSIAAVVSSLGAGAGLYCVDSSLAVGIAVGLCVLLFVAIVVGTTVRVRTGGR